MNPWDDMRRELGTIRQVLIGMFVILVLVLVVAFAGSCSAAYIAYVLYETIQALSGRR